MGKIEEYVAINYDGRTPATELSSDALLSELHELIEAGPELHGLITDHVAGREAGKRRATSAEAVKLQRNIEALQGRAASLWNEFNHRFGQARRV